MTKMIPTDNAAFLNAFGMIVGGDTGAQRQRSPR